MTDESVIAEIEIPARPGTAAILTRRSGPQPSQRRIRRPLGVGIMIAIVVLVVGVALLQSRVGQAGAPAAAPPFDAAKLTTLTAPAFTPAVLGGAPAQSRFLTFVGDRNAGPVVLAALPTPIPRPGPEAAFKAEKATLTLAPPAGLVQKTVAARRGDTLMKVVTKAGADRRESYEAIRALSRVFDPRRLKIGQAVTVSFDPAERGAPDRLMGLHIVESVDREVVVRRTEDGTFRAGEIVNEYDKRIVRVSGAIEDSLFLAARRAGLPTKTILDVIRILSFDVDFQREIYPGDRFDILFERYVDDQGKPVKDGDVLIATLEQKGGTLTYYRYRPNDDGRVDYFNAAGHSVKKTLMRTPIDGARLSSRFGKRRHPILGYTRMHRGVDFAAPRGTPIMAAGDGVLALAGWNGGYGRYIRIRHNGSYSTAYAHMTRLAKGMRRGKRVHQGQIIGYVGTTGRSTGPHLHYEVLKNGRQVNPLSVRLPTGRKLKGGELARFTVYRETLDHEAVAAAAANATVAAAGD